MASASASVHTLPDGTWLRDYEITGLIGEGGFGIVYLAFDHSLQRRVAIKEYMPSSMASRAAGSAEVLLKSDRHLDTFKAGLRSFVNEARLLARFDHPSLVKVYRFWEDNGTAYMVMPYYEGPTLKHALAERSQPPDEAELRTLLRPLLSALAVMHAEHCFHRDVAPDNILLTPGGPLLLDFGAARRVIGDMTHALTVVLKPGFAPIEQYGEVSSMGQGAWTDLYALASVVYAAVTGQPPISSVERLMDDRMPRFSEAAAGRYSESFTTTIDTALALRPRDRPQSVEAFQRLLDGPLPQGAPVLSAETPRSRRRSGLVVAVTGLAFAAIGAVMYSSLSRTTPEPVPAVRPPAGGTAASAADTDATPAATGGPVDMPVSPASAPPRSLPLNPVRQAPRQDASTKPPPPSSRSVRAVPVPALAPVPGPVLGPGPASSAALAPPPASPAASAPVPAPGTASRCSDILQKASLEPLTNAERELLKRECR